MEIIKLNLIPSGVNPTCHAKQYDKGRIIRFELFNGLTPYTLQSGDTVTLNLRKPDNTIIESSVTATQGNKYVDLVTTEQMCAVAGYNLGTFKIVNGETDIGTLNFIMAVERDVLADGIASQSVIEDLEELVQEAVGDNYYTKTEVDSAFSETNNNIRSNADLIRSLYEEEEELVVDAYDSLNTSLSNINMPFIYKEQNIQYRGTLLTAIKLNVKITGSIVVGYLPLESTSYDVEDCVVMDTLTATETGEQIIVFNKPFIVPEGFAFFMGLPNDSNSLRFAFGGQGNDKGFYYRYSTTEVYVHSGNSLGVNLYGIRNDNKSVYKNKTLSILGDSISTFNGYIPSGNVSYYPSGDVTSVNDTWWKKLISALGMKLNINNSWSGSYVTTNNGDASAGCGDRAENLGTDPDVIIIYMGINDFNNEVQLGTYDGTSAIPSSTTTFKEAYAIMLNKVLTKYKTSEVYVCTLPQCERNTPSGEFPEINGNGDSLFAFNKAIVELAAAFGVKVLDHNKCGLTYQNMSVYNPNTLHPNAKGHSLIANNDIRQLDNFVRYRYNVL